MRAVIQILFSLVLLLGAASSQAETPLQTVPGELPNKGLSMEQVKDKLGPPLEVKPSVGNPPISRWMYENFTVYFEYQHVIHSVRHTKPSAL